MDKSSRGPKSKPEVAKRPEPRSDADRQRDTDLPAMASLRASLGAAGSSDDAQAAALRSMAPAQRATTMRAMNTAMGNTQAGRVAAAATSALTPPTVRSAPRRPVVSPARKRGVRAKLRASAEADPQEMEADDLADALAPSPVFSADHGVALENQETQRLASGPTPSHACTAPVTPSTRKIPSLVQAKLFVSSECDPLEKEADALAEVLLHPLEFASAPRDDHNPRGPNRARPGRRNIEWTFAPSVAQEVGLAVPEALGADLAALVTGGIPLGADERAFFESRFGLDLAEVRVHTGEAAGELCTALQARAFAHGRHIVLGSEAMTLATPDARQLMAHELVHVLQQGALSLRSLPDAASDHATHAGDGAPSTTTGPAPERYQLSHGDTSLIQRDAATVDFSKLPKISVVIRKQGDANIVVVQGVDAFRVTPKTPGAPACRGSGGGYSSLKGKEYARSGNSVSLRFSISLSYEEEVRVEPIATGIQALQSRLPSVEFTAFAKLVPKPPPMPISQLKLVIARQQLGQTGGSFDPNELIGPRADVALAETIDLSSLAKGPTGEELARAGAEAMKYGIDGKPKEGDTTIHGLGKDPLIPDWMRLLRARPGKFGQLEIWSADGQPVVSPDGSYLTVGADGLPVKRNSIAADVAKAQFEQNQLQPYFLLAASGGTRTLPDGRVLSAAEWKDYVWTRFQIIQAQVNRKLVDLSEGVAIWNDLQTGVAAIASVPVHFFAGRSRDDANKILAQATQDVQFNLAQIPKALTPAQLEAAEKAVMDVFRRGEAQFYSYKDEVIVDGGERTITVIKVVAVAAVAAAAGPAIFAAAGGKVAGATLGAKLLATSASALGSGLLTGTMGGYVEGLHKGFTWENYGKGFAENFTSGFTAGLTAGASAILKVEQAVGLSKLAREAAIGAGTGAIDNVANAALHNATNLDPSAPADDPTRARKSLLDEALKGAGSGILNSLVNHASAGLVKPADAGAAKAVVRARAAADFAIQKGADAAIAGLHSAVGGGSERDIKTAIVQSGLTGLASHGVGMLGGALNKRREARQAAAAQEQAPTPPSGGPAGQQHPAPQNKATLGSAPTDTQVPNATKPVPKPRARPRPLASRPGHPGHEGDAGASPPPPGVVASDRGKKPPMGPAAATGAKDQPGPVPPPALGAHDKDAPAARGHAPTNDQGAVRVAYAPDVDYEIFGREMAQRARETGRPHFLYMSSKLGPGSNALRVLVLPTDSVATVIQKLHEVTAHTTPVEFVGNGLMRVGKPGKPGEPLRGSHRFVIMAGTETLSAYAQVLQIARETGATQSIGDLTNGPGKKRSVSGVTARERGERYRQDIDVRPSDTLATLQERIARKGKLHLQEGQHLISEKVLAGEDWRKAEQNLLAGVAEAARASGKPQQVMLTMSDRKRGKYLQPVLEVTGRETPAELVDRYREGVRRTRRTSTRPGEIFIDERIGAGEDWRKAQTNLLAEAIAEAKKSGPQTIMARRVNRHGEEYLQKLLVVDAHSDLGQVEKQYEQARRKPDLRPNQHAIQEKILAGEDWRVREREELAKVLTRAKTEGPQEVVLHDGKNYKTRLVVHPTDTLDAVVKRYAETYTGVLKPNQHVYNEVFSPGSEALRVVRDLVAKANATGEMQTIVRPESDVPTGKRYEEVTRVRPGESPEDVLLRIHEADTRFKILDSRPKRVKPNPAADPGAGAANKPPPGDPPAGNFVGPSSPVWNGGDLGTAGVRQRRVPGVKLVTPVAGDHPNQGSPVDTRPRDVVADALAPTAGLATAQTDPRFRAGGRTAEMHNHIMGVLETSHLIAEATHGNAEAMARVLYEYYEKNPGEKAGAKTSWEAVQKARDILERANRIPQKVNRAKLESVLRKHMERALETGPKTLYPDTYESRDAISKEALDKGHKTYDKTAHDVIEHLHADGIHYSEMSTSANKLNQRFTLSAMAAAHAANRAKGTDVDMRFLAAFPTEHFGPLAHTDQMTKKYEALLAQMKELVKRPDVIGFDIASPETGRFSEKGIERMHEVMKILAEEAQRRGRDMVFRPHAGEGFAPLAGQPQPPGAESHQEIARANIGLALKAVRTSPDMHRENGVGLVVRFGHATHASPAHIQQMGKMGIIAESNIGSNVRTGSIPSIFSHPEGKGKPGISNHPLLTNLYYDTPTVLSTDAHGVMTTSMKEEYARAGEIIDAFKAGKIRVKVAKKMLRWNQLTAGEQAKFDINRLWSWQSEYFGGVEFRDATSKLPRITVGNPASMDFLRKSIATTKEKLAELHEDPTGAKPGEAQELQRKLKRTSNLLELYEADERKRAEQRNGFGQAPPGAGGGGTVKPPVKPPAGPPIVSSDAGGAPKRPQGPVPPPAFGPKVFRSPVHDQLLRANDTSFDHPDARAELDPVRRLLRQVGNDTATGAHAPEVLPDVLAHAQQHVQKYPDQAIRLVTVEVKNLAGLNTDFGTTGANKVLSDIVNRVTTTMRLPLMEKGTSVTLVRLGGAKLALVVVGPADGKSVTAALRAGLLQGRKVANTAAEPLLGDPSVKRPVRDMLHPKYPNDPRETGSGISVLHSVQIDPTRPISDQLAQRRAAVQAVDDGRDTIRKRRNPAQQQPAVEQGGHPELPDVPRPKGKTTRFEPGIETAQRQASATIAADRATPGTAPRAMLREAAEALKLVARDKTTGLYTRGVLAPTIAEVIDYRRTHSGESGAVVVFDVKNLSGMSDHLGHTAADVHFLAMIKILERVQGQELSTAKLVGIRFGGDEFGFVAVGPFSPAQLRAAVSKASAAVERYVQSTKVTMKESGLEVPLATVPHRKKNKPPGTGVTAAIVPIGRHSTPKEILGAMDALDVAKAAAKKDEQEAPPAGPGQRRHAVL